MLCTMIQGSMCYIHVHERMSFECFCGMLARASLLSVCFTIDVFVRGRVIIVISLKVEVFGGIAPLQHGDVLHCVRLLHIHVFSFLLK